MVALNLDLEPCKGETLGKVVELSLKDTYRKRTLGLGQPHTDTSIFNRAPVTGGLNVLTNK